jgi:hypothetical protein
MRTRSLREAAQSSSARFSHPENRIRKNAEGDVIGGYGVVQPRVRALPASSRRSRFARIMAGPPGIDAYTNTVSDVYQDVFGSGSYDGKAIYDVAAFRQALEGRVPDNRLLSHDLFEGIFVRTALASDIEVLDEQPSSYAALAARQHRWIRGDFQLIPWLRRRVPAPEGAERESDLPPLGRWKLFDNLRRAFIAPSLAALAIAGWLYGSVSALVTVAPGVGHGPASTGAWPVRVSSPAIGPAIQPVVTDVRTATGQICLNAIFRPGSTRDRRDRSHRVSNVWSRRKHLLEGRRLSTEQRLAGKVPPRLP